MKRITLFCTIFTIMLCGYTYADTGVNVNIPSFEITINDKVFDNRHAAYPFIIYDDITYVPLTYNLCRELGVITGWDSKKGLYLAKYAEDFFEYKADLGGNYKKGASYKAFRPTYPVVLNGVDINSKSVVWQYPVLVFNNITYLPLTWEYVYYEFGWDIDWDSVKGLYINSNNTNIYSSDLKLSEINDDFVLLQSRRDIYDEIKNEDGSITYQNTYKEEIKNYKLDLLSNTLTYEGLAEKPNYYNNPNENYIICEGDLFTIDDNNLYYNDNIIDKLSAIEMNNPYLYVKKWVADNASFYEVSIYTTDQIPAPYTPMINLVFKESADGMVKIDNWYVGDYLDKVYKLGDSYYLCSYGRKIAGRWSNSLCTVIKIEADGSTTIINDKYDDYCSIRAIGTVNDRIVVEATWFGDPQLIDQKGKVSAINDGYFYLDKSDNLEKLCPYIEGTAFLAPNGHLYLLSDSRILIFDMTTGERIKIK